MTGFIPIFQTYPQVFSVKNCFKAALFCAFSFIPIKTFSQDIKLEEMLVIKGVCSKLIAKKVTGIQKLNKKIDEKIDMIY